MRQTKN